ncbi:MAG: phosphoenolpyruvate--protein phosphotransferase [Pseudomonadota bacterium]
MSTARDINAGPRVMMRRIREIMAEPMEPQARLDAIARQIAQSMVAEVCSSYVLRADGVLELFATVGLKAEAVHLSQLKLGDGLVGVIAASSRPLNLSEAQKHPAFRYLPETGEELYNGFLGVPILRAGRTLGVLVIQNEAQRTYTEDEVEAMQTVAMVMGELIAAGDLKRLSKGGIELDLTKPVSLDGLPLGEGIGLGHVVLHEPRVIVTDMFADNAESEMTRLHDAIAAFRLTIDDMLERREVAFEGEHREVLESYRMFANDKGWMQRMEEAVRNGLTAEAAVEKVQSDMRARMTAVQDPYLRERMTDFDDLANRLLRQLMGRPGGAASGELPNDAIIVARSMGAADLLDYPRERLRGLVLEDGTATSHVVIVARAMGITVVGQAKGIVTMADSGEPIIVDGISGAIHLRPQPEVQSAYQEKVRFRAKRQAEYESLRGKPNVTLDGKRFKLLMNAGLLVDLPQLKASNACGIGLFRTELQFMISAQFPKTEAQEQLYRQVLVSAGDKPVTFRTLDIGGDKVLPYFKNAPEEENPALGWRAIRIALDRPGIFKTQLRALLKAAGGRDLNLMLPMITEIEEITKAREILDAEVRHLSRFGHPLPSKLRVGSMLEVPALLFQLDALCEAVDFISIGSNDLYQFMMAADRGNTFVSNRFDILHPAFLRALRQIATTAEKHNTEVTLCGEMAGTPISAIALVAIGINRLSMSPAALGPVKAALLKTDVGALKMMLDPICDYGNDALSVRSAIERFCAVYHIEL